MNTLATKTQENKSQATLNHLSQEPGGLESLYPFEELGRNAIAQRNMQHIMKSSLRVQQLEANQEMANNSRQVNQTVQLRSMSNDHSTRQKQSVQRKENNTGLPDHLKTGVEHLSGISLDGVKVHYNSSEPAQINALAYAQGSDIHVAPGQEKHLPHEAWHVVQQARGRVKPTMQLKDGIPVNDDHGLEKEADLMGAKALSAPRQKAEHEAESPIQGKFETAQLWPLEEEELLQGKFAPMQRKAQSPATPIATSIVGNYPQSHMVQQVAPTAKVDELFGATQGHSPSAIGSPPQQVRHEMQQTGQSLQQPVQCRFDDGADFLLATATTVDFQAIAAAMDEYNNFLDNPAKEPQDYGEAASNLQLVERKIFAYINANNATHEKLTDIPHYAALEALRVKAGEEHEDFVEMAAAGDHLPFDFAGISPQQSISLIRLWNQIKGGMGKIKLVGDPANKKQMLSWLVKLLETPTGRQLLSYLNAGDPMEALTNIYIGQTKDQLPMGVESGAKTKGKTLEDTGVSEAQPLGSSGEIRGPLDLSGTEKPHDYLMATSPADFRTALLQHRKGVILNGKKYEFNESVSVGAFVTAHEGASKNESATHHQIMTPGWVTMGHELGHAAHMRGGSTNMMDMANSPGKPGIMETITGQNAEKLNSKWQNGEEFLTINNWENSLRGDVGLTARDSHIPYTAGKKVERYYNIWPDIKATFQDGAYFETPTLSKFIKDLKAAFNSKDPTLNLENDIVYQTLMQRWLVIKTTNLDAEAIQVKKDRIKQKYEDMDRKYQRKLLLYNAKWFPSKSKKTEWNNLVAERAVIANIYPNNLNAHIDLNVNPTTSSFGSLLKRITDAEDGFYKFNL